MKAQTAAKYYNLSRSNSSKDRSGTAVLVKKFLGTCQRIFSNLLAAEKSGDFFNSSFTVKFGHAGFSALIYNLLLNKEMIVGTGGHLRQVGHADYLGGFPDLVKKSAYHIGGLTGNSGINFIKNQTRCAYLLCIDFLNCQGYSGQFTA